MSSRFLYRLMARYYKLYLYLIIIGLLLMMFGCVTTTPKMQIKTWRGQFIVAYDVIQYLDTVYTVIDDDWTPRSYKAEAYDNTGQVYIFRTDFYSLKKYKVEYNDKLRRWQYTPKLTDAVVRRFK